MKINPYKDVLGNEIKTGDYIVYGAAKGRCAGLNIGRVVSASVVKDEYEPKPFLKVKAASVQVSWGEYYQAGKDEYADKKAKPRTVSLRFAERMCVISPELVSPAIKELLNYS